CVLSVQAPNTFEDAWTDPDALIVGGGAKPTLDLLADSATIACLAGRRRRARWVCRVCTGCLLLGPAGLLLVDRGAGRSGARDAWTQVGAEPSSERGCVDRKRLTGGGITAGVDFGITVAGHWAGESVGRVIELIMEYAPQPPYGTGRPDLADAQTLAAARAAMQQAMTGVSE